MIKNCTQCGCEFNAHQQRVIFCSRKCYTKNQNKKIKKECIICKKEFMCKQSIAQKYCSIKCKSSDHTKITNRKCVICDSFFKPRSNKNMFCSPKCRGKGRVTKIEKECLTCSLKFRSNGENSKYCSNRCHHYSMRIQNKMIQNHINCLDSVMTWENYQIENIFELSTINIDEQLNAKSYVGSLKRRY